MWPALCLATLLMPAGTHEPLRGVLVDREGDAQAGQISVRGPDFHVHVFLYDSRTEIWREGRAIAASALRAGDTVEVACRAEVAPRCPAGAIRVLIAAPAASRGVALPGWGRPDWNTSPFPRGQLLMAGMISEIYPDHIRLRMRGGGRQMVRLREDTRFLGDGLAAERPELRVNMHVFVRAGRGLEGDLEAFLVVWGRILPAR